MFRAFTDKQGRRWDVGVGRESYGMQVLLFAAAAGGEVRKALMHSNTWLEAEQELAGLSDAALQERLEASQPWE